MLEKKYRCSADTTDTLRPILPMRRYCEYRPINRHCRYIGRIDGKPKQDPEVNDASSSHFFIFHFFYNFFIFSLSSSLLPPRRSFLLVAPSSSSPLPPCPSFLLVPSSFCLVQHCLNHLESIKGHFSSILTKALRTDGRTNGRTDGPTNGRTRPLIEMRRRN